MQVYLQFSFSRFCFYEELAKLLLSFFQNHKINSNMSERIKTYREFYQFYLTEHSKMGTRIFHFLGTLLVFVVIGYVISSGKERFLWYLPIFGYGFAWFSIAAG